MAAKAGARQQSCVYELSEDSLRRQNWYSVVIHYMPAGSAQRVIRCGAERRGKMDDRTRFAVCGIDSMRCSIHLSTREELNYWRAKNVDLDKIACDTWHDGRFMEHRVDPHVLEGLRPAFAHYDRDDIGRALLATMELFRWVAKEAAEWQAFTYPTAADEYATELVGTLLPPDNQICTGDGP